MPKIYHTDLVQYFAYLAENHVDIEGFYRFDISEIQSRLRSGAGNRTLMLEAAEIGFIDSQAQEKALAFTFAYTITGPCTKDDHDKKNTVINDCMKIAMEVERRILQDSEDPSHWLYNRYEATQTQGFKVGPIFADTRWGYRVEVTLANTDPRYPEAAKWTDL